jgi:AcrR family transcriptional regulator
MGSIQQKRLTSEEWLRAGLDALAENGPKALRARRLAEMLGVTTGSFYWHFGGVEDFRSELLVYWKNSVIQGLIDEARARAREPAQLLPELNRFILESRSHRYDAAMRSWAQTDPAVRKNVEEADGLRASFLKEALRHAGIEEEGLPDQINLMGATWHGSADQKDPEYRMKLVGMTLPPLDGSRR